MRTEIDSNNEPGRVRDRSEVRVPKYSWEYMGWHRA